ncbi:MAG: DUF488 domain-containing protein [Bacteroidales bacterium]|jgi:uncharacterized protein (DUF488 family)|nr:DUF488 domain-containing protein [Bacteroidales bacterium]
MLYYRRKILLALLYSFGGELTAKSLQKYLFLISQKQKEQSYDFIPYKYGCFSFQANQDVYTLQKYGYINIIQKEDGRFIHLIKQQEDYYSYIKSSDKDILNEIKNKFGSLSQMDLIRYTYIEYPFYAIKSSIAQNILTNKEYVQVLKQKKTYNDSMLFTIGYQGISLEAYICTLINNDVRVLCDVRKNAYSQKYGFSKSQLQKACEGVDIKYIHIPSLGIDSTNRQNLNSQEDYDKLFEIYKITTLKDNTYSLNVIRELLRKEKRIALTCFEKDPNQCHRTYIAQQLMQIEDRDYKLKNL